MHVLICTSTSARRAQCACPVIILCACLRLCGIFITYSSTGCVHAWVVPHCTADRTYKDDERCLDLIKFNTKDVQKHSFDVDCYATPCTASRPEANVRLRAPLSSKQKLSQALTKGRNCAFLRLLDTARGTHCWHLCWSISV